MEKIINLITGGSGFIGSHLSEYLLREGEKVICLDNLMTGNKNNNDNFKDNPNYKFILHDVLEPIDIFANRIWHLASLPSPISYRRDPILTSKINFTGTLNMLELAKKNNSKILFASTSEIYGKCNSVEQVESFNGLLNTSNERSCYFESKRIAETLVFDFMRIHNVDAKVARIFNTYGPRMSISDGRVVNNLIFQGLSNKKLTIAGTGNQTRTFCYISDLINALYKLMNSNVNESINLGNDEEITINSLADLICLKLDIPRNYEFYNISQSEPFKRKPSISMAKRLLSWEPKVNLEEGLEKTIEYCKKVLFKN